MIEHAREREGEKKIKKKESNQFSALTSEYGLVHAFMPVHTHIHIYTNLKGEKSWNTCKNYLQDKKNPSILKCKNNGKNDCR